MSFGKMLSSVGKTVASAGAAAAIGLTPSAAKAGEQHNHAVLGVESTKHSSMFHGGYFREIGHHLSLGLAAGVGADYHGSPVGSAEAVLAYHKTVRGDIFGVLEAGVGAEVLKGGHGVHAAPVAKLTGLLGYQATPSVGVYVGPSVVRVPGSTDVSLSVGTVLGF